MTKVEYRTGDLFAQDDLDAIAHGVNLRGLMGSGIAVVFKKNYPKMYEEYKNMCEEQTLQLGSVFHWFGPVEHKRGLPAVFNIATQVSPGKDARLPAIEVGLINAVREAEYRGIESIGLPRIGAGIGGLDWEDVKNIIEKVAETTSVKLVVVSLD